MIKGIMGKKLGMTQVFQQDGSAVPVTVIQAGPCWVTQIKTDSQDGYTAVQLGYEEIGAGETDETRKAQKIENRMSKPERGHLGLLESDENHPDRKVLPQPLPALKHLQEFRISDLAGLSEGLKITVDVFKAGDHVDVIGTSKGKGFAGTIKRHNFNRQPKTHGASDRTRAPGSIGSTTTPGRVLKGTRMAGRMGGDRVTTQNLEIIVVDSERNLLAVRGSIPGARGGLVMISQTIKKQ
jgi:large subunit ribosomal protein L3